MQTIRNVLVKFGAKIAAPAAAVALLPVAAMAAVDEEITTAITTAGTDLLLVAGAVTGIMAALWAAMLIKRKFFG